MTHTLLYTWFSHYWLMAHTLLYTWFSHYWL